MVSKTISSVQSAIFWATVVDSYSIWKFTDQWDESISAKSLVRYYSLLRNYLHNEYDMITLNV